MTNSDHSTMQNWGIVSLAPAIGGNVANLVFGREYDSHVVSPPGQVQDGQT